MADLRELLGKNVRRLREERGLTQAQLAEATGRSTDMISRLERGDAAPSMETVGVLADVLNVDAAELFGGRAVAGEERIDLQLLKQISGMAQAEQQG